MYTKKVKLSRNRSRESVGCVMLRIPNFLNNQPTDGGDVGSLTRQLHFVPQKDVLVLISPRCWLGPRSGLDAVVKRKFWPNQGSNSVIQLYRLSYLGSCSVLYFCTCVQAGSLGCSPALAASQSSPMEPTLCFRMSVSLSPHLSKHNILCVVSGSQICVAVTNTCWNMCS
jgi:hypothetical protein